MADIGFFLGALVPTFLISRLFLFLMKSWDGGIQKILLAHFIALMVASLLAGMGMADGGAFAPVKGLKTYILPQILWLLFDLFRHSRSSASGKRFGAVLGVLGVIVIFAASKGVGYWFGKTTVDQFYEANAAGQLEAAQANAAAELRKQLPMQIDEITTLKSVVSAGPTVIYNYTINANKVDVDLPLFEKNMTSNLIHNTCNMKDMLATMEAGGEYTYQYLSADGLFLTAITIKKSNCN